MTDDDQRPDTPADEPAPRRGSDGRPEGVGAFAPIAHAGGTSARAPGVPAPRSRLSSSSMRRATPLPTSVAPAPAPVVTPEPETPAPIPAARTRRTGVAMLVGGALLTAVAAGGLLWSLDGGGDTGASTAQTSAQQTGPQLPAAPVPLAVDSEFVDTAVLDGGDLLVTHWIRTDRPVGRLALDVPAGSGLTAATVDVRDLTVAADGVLVEAPARAPSGDGWNGPLPGAREVVVRYRLSGVVQRSGSVSGRALATMTSLTLDLDGRPLAMTHTFSGLKVLTMACLGSEAGATPAPCGSLVDDTWTLSFEPGAVPETVIAQIDLTASPVGR